MYPIIPLYGNLSFMPIEFITTYAPLDTSRYGSSGHRGRVRAPRREEIISSAKDSLEKIDKTFCKQVSALYDEGLAWVLQAETDLAPSERTHNTVLFDSSDAHRDIIFTPSHQENTVAMNAVKYKTGIILHGLTVSRRATLMLKYFLFLHTYLCIPIPPTHIRAIDQLCTISKSVETTLAVRRRSCIISTHKAALKLLSSSLYSRFDHLR